MGIIRNEIRVKPLIPYTAHNIASNHASHTILGLFLRLLDAVGVCQRLFNTIIPAMRIAIVNYRYFLEGGPERYLFNITDLLTRHGHEVVPFSIHNTRNAPTPYEHYFLDSIDDEVRYDKSSKSPKKILRSFTRMFYSLEARSKFGRFLDDVKPDIVYIVHYHNKISPSIIDAARARGIKVVHRISDFQYICPNALFYTQGHICEKCIEGDELACVKQACVLDSKVFSAIKIAAKHFHNLIGVKRKISAFVVPSRFTIGRLVKGGMPQEKMHLIPTFFNLKDTDHQVEYGDFFLFVGRLTPQKGLATLIKAFAGTDLKLKVVGAAPGDDYDIALKRQLESQKHNIEFLGPKKFDDIIPLLKKCRAFVMPAEGYDNFPNVILESFGFKKAVIASDCGSLPEPVENGVTGLTFTTADPDDLRRKVNMLANDQDLARRLGENAWQKVNSEYSPETHYNRLINLFNQLLENDNDTSSQKQ